MEEFLYILFRFLLVVAITVSIMVAVLVTFVAAFVTVAMLNLA